MEPSQFNSKRVNSISVREAAKNSFFSGQSNKKGGGGVKGCPLRKQERTSFYRREDHRIFITKNRT